MTDEELTCSGCGEYAGSHISDRIEALRQAVQHANDHADAAIKDMEALVKERDEAKRLMQARHREMLAADGLMRKHQRRALLLEAALRVARVHVANNAEGWSVSRGAARNDLTTVDAAMKGECHE